MMIILIFAQAGTGFLNVRADQDSLPVFVDNDYIGRTPIMRYPLKTDEYNIGFYPQDSIETASWQLKQGKLGALWRIAKYGEGTVKANIADNSVTTVELNYKRTMAAPGKTKLKVFGCMGGVFTVGILAGIGLSFLF
jgi:hypothetical protein